MRKLRRFRSPCACAKYQPFLSILTFCRPWSDSVNAQADQGLRCPHMPGHIFARHSPCNRLNSLESPAATDHYKDLLKTSRQQLGIEELSITEESNFANCYSSPRYRNSTQTWSSLEVSYTYDNHRSRWYREECQGSSNAEVFRWNYLKSVKQEVSIKTIIAEGIKGLAYLFNCTPVGRGSDTMMAPT